ncbi:MAG: Crp/Fnr family transcriptional regulator [Hyphomicrobiaceae bacterium]|nr:Crp/Fnr family transcriptional regulator [Hyphomicrobiaceae bacterium]
MGRRSMPGCDTTDLGRCESCAVRRFGLCNALTRDELRQIRQIANRRVYKPGDQILIGEEETPFFAAIYSGAVKLSKILFDGRQQVVGLLLAPDCLGRVFGKPSPYFAEATTDVELCCFPHTAFQKMLDDYPELKQRLLEQTIDELDSARDWMVLLGRKSAEERVASLLLMLAMRLRHTRYDARGTDCPVVLDLYLKRHEIGDYLGLTYETVCRQIRNLCEKNLISQSGRRQFTVPSLSALAQAAG